MYKGILKNKNNDLLDILATFNFYADNPLVKLNLTIRNTRSSEHNGGFWDLGDKNSIFLKDLSIKIDSKEKSNVFYKDNIKNKFKKINEVSIYQDSSGNNNWKSQNHVNKDNKLNLSFKGYKVFSKNQEIKKGDYAQPTVLLKNKNLNLSASLKDFWQTFPKSIEANKNEITIRLFPRQSDYLHELQPGEQKTHEIYFDFEGNDLSWVQHPLIVELNSDYISETNAIPYLTKNYDSRYSKYINNAIKGKDSFENKNLEIDEFGWRNFGDFYADHEAIHKKGMISHYNNQYDVVNGLLIQFLKTNNIKWFNLAKNQAKHVIDIDIYHTNKDKSAYNKGMFWHTFHYMDAKTCTHRSYSKKGINTMNQFKYGSGGGPSNEHNYATGLMNYYFLTGDNLAKESVINLAEWIIDMDDGSKSKLKFISKKPTGKASQSRDKYYHGPGRGSGNSVNVLLDGFQISNNEKYLKKSEEIIKRCIHPKDNIKKNNLEDIENRWFYLVFLQSLGRYLDIKYENNQLDFMFYYAKESLDKYAKWMSINEKPYFDVLDKMDIPTETWPAHDIRKSNIFDYAYKYSGNKKFKEKSNFFFNRCITDLNKFKTKYLLRPMVIIMSFSYIHENNIKPIKIKNKKINFGKPKKFKPQGYYFFKLRDIISNLKSKIK